MKLKMIRTALTLVLGLGISSVAAYADTLTFSILNGTQSGSAGSTLSYSASVAAPTSNSATIFLNGDGFSGDSPIGPFTLDDSGFYSDFPLSLDPGDSFSGLLFTLTLPANTPAGTYNGTFSILGGPNSSSNQAIGTATFSATIPPPVPEPSSFLLLATGLASVFTLHRKKF